MREVLPGGRKHRGVGGTEEAKNRLAWDAAEKSCTRLEAELQRAPLESRPVWPVARDHERTRQTPAGAPRAGRRPPSAGLGVRRTRGRARRARAQREARRASASVESRVRDWAEPSRALRRAPNAVRHREGTSSGRRRVGLSSAPRSASRGGSAADRLLGRAGTRRACRRSARCASHARRPRRTRASRRAASAQDERRWRLAGSCSSRRRRRRGGRQRERAARTAHGAAAIDAPPT